MKHDHDEFFLTIAEQIGANSSTCLSRQVGAILRTPTAVVTSYNGTGEGEVSCKELGHCIRKEKGYESGQGLQICRAIHAEVHALINMKKIGGTTKGATIYVSAQPCDNCADELIKAGIVKVVYREPYPYSNSLEKFKKAGIEVIKK